MAHPELVSTDRVEVFHDEAIFQRIALGGPRLAQKLRIWLKQMTTCIVEYMYLKDPPHPRPIGCFPEFGGPSLVARFLGLKAIPLRRSVRNSLDSETYPAV